MSVKNNLPSFAQAQSQMATKIQALDLKLKPIVYRIEIKIKPVDLINWLEAQTATVKIYGANQDNSAAIAGIGEAKTVNAPPGRNLTVVFKQLRQYLTPQYPYMQWYGGFCFDDARLDHDWKDFGACRFVMPRFELGSVDNRMIFCCNLIGPINETKRKKILKELTAISIKQPSKALLGDAAYRRKDLPSPSQWAGNVNRVLKAIEQKKLAKVVLARKTRLSFAKPLNAWDILRPLQKVTPNSYHFCFQFGKTTFLGASPERLYKRHGRRVISEAIAGTSPRGKTAKADAELKSELINSQKNNNEHQFVIDAIRENLAPLCDQLNHEPTPDVISLGNGHHLITRFEGALKGSVKDEDVLQSLHPTPAVAGTPRNKALGTIRRLEKFARGWYAGPLGYVGLDWAEMVVGIRSGVVKGKILSVYAGAGIVAGSKAQAEWDEIENKISNFIKVIK